MSVENDRENSDDSARELELSDAAEVGSGSAADAGREIEGSGASDARPDSDAGADDPANEVVAAGVAEEEFDEGLNKFGFRPDEMVEEDEEYEDEGVAAGAGISPLEEFVDDAVGGDEQISGEGMEWYILKVQVNRENSICDALKRKVRLEGMDSFFGDVLVPTEDVREYTKTGKQRVVKRKLYPGYIVVQMKVTEKSWFLVRETDGIGDFTGAGGKPIPLTGDEITRIMRTTRPEVVDGAEEVIKTSIPFKLEDRVRVKEGYFQNYEGEVSNVDERNGRVTVLINIFGRPNPVELDHWHVEKV